MKNNKKTILQILTCGVFIIFILALTVVNLFAPKLTYSENENRALTEFPEVSIRNIFFGDFDTQFESWFTDHFVSRDAWIQIKARTRQLTGSIENNTVYLSDEGRLIQQFMTYDQKVVENNVNFINTFASANNIKANIILIPGASFGEKQFLPFGAYNLDEQTMIRSIGTAFPDQNFIDITDAIASDDDLYFRTDHHWNENGAYKAYEAICSSVLNKEPGGFNYEKVAEDFKGTMYSKSGAFWTEGDAIYKITSRKNTTMTVTYEDGTVSDSLYVDENLNEKDKYTYYMDGNHAHVNIKTSVDNGKKAVVIADSYAHIFIPYLAEEYSEIDVVDLRYYRQSVSSMLTDTSDVYVLYSLETFCSDTNLALLW